MPVDTFKSVPAFNLQPCKIALYSLFKYLDIHQFYLSSLLMKPKKERRGPPTLTVNWKRMALHLIIRWMKFLSHQCLRMQILLIVKWKKITLSVMLN